MKINNKNYKFKIAVIPGDGIGKEVINASLTILKAILDLTNIKISKTIFPWGSNYFRKHGIMMPKNGVKTLLSFDAILFGAVGDPEISDDITLWGLRLEICQKLDQFVNLRPSKFILGFKSPLNYDLA
ncbi:uncharacterized protein METZ01_LOCUS261145, partial [marine metagenome]